MSKICGLLDPTATKQAIEERLRAMAKAMKHYPTSPEEYLLFEGGGIALVGNPTFSARERRWATNEERGSRLALCGRVVGLRGDTSLPPSSPPRDDGGTPDGGGANALLHAFEEQGEDILKELNGTFAFAHHDTTTRSLTLANDRYGLMPLYYYYCEEEEGAFLFASEVKAILRVIRRSPKLDWESVADFFYVGHMMGQKTLFEGVRLLDSGQVLTYHEGTLKKRQYYDFTRTPVLSPEEVSTEKLASLFVEAVRRRVREDKPNTLLLSGGFDSRLILGAMHKLGVTPNIVTLEHGRQAGGTDGKLAVLMAQRLGLECDFRRTRADFFASPDSVETFYIQDGMVPTWDAFAVEVYPELDGGMGAVWDGLVLDVGLGGSSRQPIAGIRRNTKRFAISRGRQAGVPNGTLDRLLLGLILTPRWFRAANKGFMRRLRGELDKIPPSENQIQNFLLKGRLRRRVAVNPHQLYSAKIEPLTPGTDIDFMDYAHRIPDDLKTNQKLYIEMLRSHFPVLTEVPIHSGGSIFHFKTDQLTRRYPVKRRLRRMVKRTLKMSRYLQISLSRWISRGHSREYPALPTGGYDSHLPPQLVIWVLKEKHFERPFYNKRLLRRLFSAYRDGHIMYHHLFTIVFYIELWHLLFVDEDSSILFNPKNLQRSVATRAIMVRGGKS